MFQNFLGFLYVLDCLCLGRSAVRMEWKKMKYEERHLILKILSKCQKRAKLTRPVVASGEGVTVS